MTRADYTVDDLITELAALSQSDCKPFPYKGCRRLLRTTSKRTKRYNDLIPDLDWYQTHIAGWCSWKQKIRKLPLEKMQEAREYASRSFFEATPHYKRLEPRITKRFTPDLYDNLCLFEQMRHTLLEILDLLIAEKEKALSRSNESSSS